MDEFILLSVFLFGGIVIGYIFGTGSVFSIMTKQVKREGRHFFYWNNVRYIIKETPALGRDKNEVS